MATTPAGAVKARLHKARGALRASLRDYQPERHVAMVSHPDAVADLIKSAASSVAS